MQSSFPKPYERHSAKNKCEAVSVDAEGSRFRPLVLPIQQAAERLLKLKGLSRVEVAIYLVNDDLLPKNVLSFPAASSFPHPDTRKKPLGEIFLNPLYISRHGESLRSMLIHGILHLLGYDHKTTRDRIRMEREEEKLFADDTLCRILS